MDEKQEKKLDKVVAAESFWQKYAIQLIMLVFIAGGGWVTLSEVKALAEENKEKIEQQEDADEDQKIRLTRIETRQEQLIRDVAEQKEISREILREIREQKDED